MQNIIIIGNSGAALECHACVKEILAISSFYTLYDFKGFLAYNGFAGSLGSLQSLSLGSDTDYTPLENDIFVLGIGDNTIRKSAYEAMKSRNGKFMNLISPSVFIGENVQIGEGNNILKHCSISENITIGNANYLNGHIILGHDVQIGDYNFLAPRSTVLGNVKVGNNNSIAPQATLMEKSKIGNNNKIAPSAVVYKGCKDNAIMAGNPALKIASTESEILV